MILFTDIHEPERPLNESIPDDETICFDDLNVYDKLRDDREMERYENDYWSNR